MIKKVLYVFIVLVVLIGTVTIVHINNRGTAQRSTDFNFDWEFALVQDSIEFSAEHNEFQWKQVRLPHDWSVEHSFDSANGDGATAYLPGGYGTYRKKFQLENPDSKTTYITFDGVYNNATVILNGTELGFHPNGYAPFFFDISDELNVNGQGNTIEVKVDRSRYIDSRWYPGSGIYRNVKLVQVSNLHIPIWGVFVTTQKVDSNKAEIKLEISVKNNFAEDQKLRLKTVLLDRNGSKVEELETQLDIPGSSSKDVEQTTIISNPEKWDIDDPALYTALTTIEQNGNLIDEYETSFGVREFSFDKDLGFSLNGKKRSIKGVCLHHDGGMTGAAVPIGVWKRRLAKLKEAGCNAIRVAHNPASEEFLDLCDEMGFLVQEEFFDEWDYPKDKRLNQQEQHDDYVSRGYAAYFQEWAEKDLKSTIMRSRNHPSIFQWSIGNEIEWTYPRYAHSTGFFNMSWEGNYFWEVPPISVKQIKERYDDFGDQQYVLANTAKRLASWTRELDTSRPVVGNCILPSVSHLSGYADALDIVGYSYRRVMYDYGHEHYPEKVIMGTENLPQWHEWKSVEERPFISGTFLWTGIDYMGEAHGGWPRKGVASGLIDLAGFEKPSFHMFKTLWSNEPHVYIATQSLNKSIFTTDEASGVPVEKSSGDWENRLWTWHDVNEHWNYEKGEAIIVEVYSNCEEVELFLNEKTLGVRRLSDANDRMLKWAVPFSEGELKAVGKSAKKLLSTVVTTTYDPVAIELITDKGLLSADGYDVSHIVARFIDKNGNPVKNIEREIQFDVQGDIRILGVDNGAIDNVQDFQSDELISSKGRALMIVQSNLNKADVKISASAESLESNIIKLRVQ